MKKPAGATRSGRFLTFFGITSFGYASVSGAILSNRSEEVLIISEAE